MVGGAIEKWDVQVVTVFWEQEGEKWKGWEDLAALVHDGWEPYSVVPARGGISGHSSVGILDVQYFVPTDFWVTEYRHFVRRKAVGEDTEQLSHGVGEDS